VEEPFVRKFQDALAGLEGRIQLNERFGPEGTPVETAIGELFDFRIGDPDETGHVGAIFFNEPIPELKNVHDAWGRCRQVLVL